MFEEVGKKIKGTAVVVLVLGCLCSVIIGISLMFGADDWSILGAEDTISLIGFIIMLGGCILSWKSAIMMYGFGWLLDSLDASIDSSAVNDFSGKDSEEFTAPFSEEEFQIKMTALMELYQDHSITEEVYNQKRDDLIHRFFGA